MDRFEIEIEGSAFLSKSEFFANGVPEKIGLDEITEEIEDVTMYDLLNDWNMSDCLRATLTDTETGAVWECNGHYWTLVSDRRLLPGEQRLFK